MKVWQFGSHLTDERGARLDDWSWRQTRRRLRVLARLARPYPGRTAFALVTLVAYTAVALLPPYLAGLAVNDGIEPHDLHALSVIVAAFLAAGVAAFALSGAQTYFTGWVGERALADPRLQRLAPPTSASSSSTTSSACPSASTSGTGPARSSAGSRTTSRRSTSSSRTASPASSRTPSSSSGQSSCSSSSTGGSRSPRSSCSH